MPDRSKSKLLAAYFILIFVSGILLRIFVIPLLWSAASEITTAAIAVLALSGVLLIGVYYLKTQGSAKQIRIFYALCIGIAFGFPILVVVALVARAITGVPIQGFDVLLILAFGYAVGFIIGIPASKKIQERFFPLSD